ncbi:Target of rapamycin complex 1 subunit kog1, partial [Linderina macrospora]
CFHERLLDFYLVYLQRPDNGTEERARLRAWILLSLAELWKSFPDAKWMAMTYRLCVIAQTRQQQEEQEQRRAAMSGNGNGDESAMHSRAPSFEELLAASVEDENVDARDAQDLLIQMTGHRSPLVRASAIYALNTLLSDLVNLGDDPSVLTIIRKAERQAYAVLLHMASDGSPMVRREVVNMVGSAVFASYMPQTIEAVARVVGEEVRDRRMAMNRTQMANGSGGASGSGAGADVPAISMDLLVKLYKAMLGLSADAHPDVALPAQQVCDTVMQCYAHSRAFFEAEAAIDRALHQAEIARSASGLTPALGFLKTSGSVGDALLGSPPMTGSAAAGGAAAGRRESQAQQQQYQQQQYQQQQYQQQQRMQRRQSAQSPPLGGHHNHQQHQQQHQQRGMANGNHRYTMHVPASGSSDMDHQTEPGMPRDRFARLSDSERVEAARRMVSVERAWLEWGRHELRTSLCESTLVDWAGAHFTEFDISLFATVAGPVLGSHSLVETAERSRRIARMEADARLMGNNAAYAKWTDVSTVSTASAPATAAALMHPVEPHIVVAHQAGDVSVFDWEQNAMVGHYAVDRRKADIRSLHLVNPLGQARLLVGTNDGTVRVFSSHAPDFAPTVSRSAVAMMDTAGQVPEFPRPRLLTAFRALPWASIELPTGNHSVSSISGLSTFSGGGNNGGSSRWTATAASRAPGCGLVTAWNQHSGVLLAGGSSKSVRVWDMETEQCIEDVQISPVGGVTCMSSDNGVGHLFVVGNQDGVVRVMDRRMDARHGS